MFLINIWWVLPCGICIGWKFPCIFRICCILGPSGPIDEKEREDIEAGKHPRFINKLAFINQSAPAQLAIENLFQFFFHYWKHISETAHGKPCTCRLSSNRQKLCLTISLAFGLCCFEFLCPFILHMQVLNIYYIYILYLSQLNMATVICFNQRTNYNIFSCFHF